MNGTTGRLTGLGFGIAIAVGAGTVGLSLNATMYSIAKDMGSIFESTPVRLEPASRARPASFGELFASAAH